MDNDVIIKGYKYDLLIRTILRASELSYRKDTLVYDGDIIGRLFEIIEPELYSTKLVELKEKEKEEEE